jgi:hypothetical protein
MAIEVATVESPNPNLAIEIIKNFLIFNGNIQ